jgi:hypothetical protein
MNAQYRIETLDEKKLIALTCEKLPENNINAFSTLSVNGNVDLEKFEDIIQAIYRANQSKAKEGNDNNNKVNLVTMDDNDEKKKYYKEDPCKHCG